MIGMLLVFMSVKTERNGQLKVSAFPLLSKIKLDPFFRDEILVEPCFFDLMKRQKALLDLSSWYWNLLFWKDQYLWSCFF